MEPDLSSSITMHPHPFRLHQHDRNASSGRSSTHSPRPQTSPPAAHEHRDASSTGVEAFEMTDHNDHAAVARLQSHGTDVESQSGLSRFRDSDPYNLSASLKTDQQLNDIRANSSRKRDHADNPALKAGRALQPPFLGSRRKAKKIQDFYENQNETIQRMLKSVEEHRADAVQEQDEESFRVKTAVWGSFVANIILSILQVYGAVSSGSLSLFTTMADSIFDPLSNLMLILANRAVTRVDPNRFPSGKARLETTGNIAFSFLMTAVSLILIAFSCQELAEHPKNDETTGFNLSSVIAVAVAFVTKLALFFYCWGIKDKYSQVDILWQDHRNDLLINGFGILTSVGGSKLIWWIDPMGSIILSVLISAIWLRTAFQEFMLLVGVVASVETQQLITYVCLTHSPAILGIDTVRVYHSGPRLIAEVDVVMSPDATLRATHDVAEELQFKLEDLPDIERAYVHVDYETSHKPEHYYKKDM